MQFLAIRKSGGKRKNGVEIARAAVITKNRKFGDVLEEKNISVRQSVLITGMHASGKTYWIERLYKSAANIWGMIESPPLFLSSTRPISAWCSGNHFVLWWASRESPGEDRHWDKLKAWERLDALPLYLRETGALLFVDDAHQLSGRKLKLVQECVRAAKIWVVTAADENRISPGLRRDILNADPQTFRLESDVAYDGTRIFMWLMIAISAGMGSYEIAAILGGLQVFASGYRSAKQQ